MAEPLNDAVAIHIRFEGRSLDVPLRNLDIGPLPGDDEVKRALALYLKVPASKLRDYVVDRHPNGNLTVRPEAVFGWEEEGSVISNW